MINERTKRNLAFILVFILSALLLYQYLTISNDELPLMDFWLGFDKLATKVLSNQLTLSDCFPNPHPIHWFALTTPVSAFFIRVFSCNNLAYVYAGMLFSFFSILLILFWIKKNISIKNTGIDALFGAACVLCIINLNQWEILDLWCNATFMLRIFLYLLMFFLIDRFLIRSGETTTVREMLRGAGLGLLCSTVMIAVSAAYYPGYVAAISTVIILFLLISKGKRNRKLSTIPCLLFLIAGAALLYLTTNSNSGIANGAKPGIEYLQGFIIMLGSSVIPQSRLADGYTLYYLVGVVILIFVVESIFLFFHKKLYRKSWLPMECLVYAGITVAIIIYGRVNVFGLDTLTSSRYVVETTLGLAGIVMIQGMAISQYISEKGRKPVPYRMMSIFVTLCVAGFVLIADATEYKTGPYRKAYCQNMIQLALDIDHATDEQLTIFQAPPGEVRSGIKVMKEYDLCLWNKSSKHYLREGITKISGVWDDGWTGPNAVFRVCLEDKDTVMLKGWYGKFTDSGETIRVVSDNHIIKEYRLDSENFEFSFRLSPGFTGIIELQSNFSFVSPPDERELSFVLQEIGIAEGSEMIEDMIPETAGNTV